MYRTALPFDFKYYDMTKTAGTPIYIDTNGRLSWTDTTSDYTPTDAKMMAEQDIAVAWKDMAAYGIIYNCNLDAGGPNERTVISWNTKWYSVGETIFQAVLYKNGDIVINYANMSNASGAGHTGTGIVYKGVSRGDNTHWTLTNWNILQQNMSRRSFVYH